MRTLLSEFVSDRTFAPLQPRLATVPNNVWEEDGGPIVGERVAVSDGGSGPFEAVTAGMNADETLVVKVETVAPSGRTAG